MEEETKYEAIELVVRVPAEGDSWFDRIHDFITGNCDGESDAEICACGMQSMGGMTGTLEQVYDWQRVSDKWAFDVQTEDLKWILGLVGSHFLLDDEEGEHFDRLRKAAYWHDEFNEWLANLPDDDEEDDNAPE